MFAAWVLFVLVGLPVFLILLVCLMIIWLCLVVGICFRCFFVVRMRLVVDYLLFVILLVLGGFLIYFDGLIRCCLWWFDFWLILLFALVGLRVGFPVTLTLRILFFVLLFVSL